MDTGAEGEAGFSRHRPKISADKLRAFILIHYLLILKGFPVSSVVKNPPANVGDPDRSLGREDSVE